MMAYVTRRSAFTIIAGGAAMASRDTWAADTSGRVIYPVAIPIYQSQFVADRAGFFKEAGLDCKLIQGGSGVKIREIIASSQGDIGSAIPPTRCSSASRTRRARIDAS